MDVRRRWRTDSSGFYESRLFVSIVFEVLHRKRRSCVASQTFETESQKEVKGV